MQWCTPTCRVSITNSTFGTQPIAAPLSYKYFSECFLAEFALSWILHQIQSVTLQLQTVNRWQGATVMNFSSCLGSWQADCFDLKVWGGLMGIGGMTTGTRPRCLLAETGEWGCQGVTYELMTLDLGCAFNWESVCVCIYKSSSQTALDAVEKTRKWVASSFT